MLQFSEASEMEKAAGTVHFSFVEYGISSNINKIKKISINNRTDFNRTLDVFIRNRTNFNRTLSVLRLGITWKPLGLRSTLFEVSVDGHYLSILPMYLYMVPFYWSITNDWVLFQPYIYGGGSYVGRRGKIDETILEETIFEVGVGVTINPLLVSPIDIGYVYRKYSWEKEGERFLELKLGLGLLFPISQNNLSN